MRWIYSKSSCLERVNKGPALRPLGFRIFAFNPYIITVRKLLATPIKKKEKKKENTFLGSSWTGVIICRKLCRWIWDHSTQINELPVYTRASLFSLPLLLTSRLTLQSALLPSQDLNRNIPLKAVLGVQSYSLKYAACISTMCETFPTDGNLKFSMTRRIM